MSKAETVHTARPVVGAAGPQVVSKGKVEFEEAEVRERGECTGKATKVRNSKILCANCSSRRPC